MLGRGLCGSRKGASRGAGSRELRGEGSGPATEPAPGGSQAPAKTALGGGACAHRWERVGHCRRPTPDSVGAEARRDERSRRAGQPLPHACERPWPWPEFQPWPPRRSDGEATVTQDTADSSRPRDFPSDLPRACLQREPGGRATPEPVTSLWAPADVFSHRPVAAPESGAGGVTNPREDGAGWVGLSCHQQTYSSRYTLEILASDHT